MQSSGFFFFPVTLLKHVILNHPYPKNFFIYGDQLTVPHGSPFPLENPARSLIWVLGREDRDVRTSHRLRTRNV